MSQIYQNKYRAFLLLALIEFLAASIGRASENLILNGDFSSGLEPSTTTYTRSDNMIGSATWNLTGFDTKHYAWRDYYDHTAGDSTGQFLIVNASGPPGGLAWEQTVQSSAPGWYQLQGWFASSHPNPASLAFQVRRGPELIASHSFKAPSALGIWELNEFGFYSANTGPLTVQIWDAGPFSSGADYAVDDISLRWTAPADIFVAAGETLAFDTAGLRGVMNGYGGELKKTGTGTLVVDAETGYTGRLLVAEGTVVVGHPEAFAASTIALSANTRGILSDGLRSVSVGSVSLDTQSVFDLSSGSLTVLDGFSREQLKAELLKGRGDGFWNGAAGINSSTAAADIADGIVRSVGWTENPDGSVTVAYSAPGDTDLSGDVNIFDLVSINGSGSYGTGTPSVWSQGDFDYNGVTNIFDMVLTIGANVYRRGSYLPAVTSAVSVNAVPEPSVCLLAFAGLAGGYCALRRRET
jgi:autotransporter-associated beta strand protein